MAGTPPRVMTAELKTLRFYRAPVADFETLNRHYHVHVHSDDHSDFIRGHLVQGHEIDSIRFENGQLFVDDVPILKPDFGTDTVTWRQQTQSHFTSGYLYFASEGKELHGVVSRGTNAQDAVTQDILATSVPIFASTLAQSPDESSLSHYTTQITTQRYAADHIKDPYNLPKDDWRPGARLGIGY